MTYQGRTFAPATFRAAQDAWAAGEFSSEWRDLRHVMAMQGCIFPPAGTRWDSWEDDAPSQRAVLIRAIRETPALLAKCARGATSWQQLIGRLIAERDDWRAEMRPVWEAEERALDRRRMTRVSESLGVLADSIGAPAPGETA